MEDKSVILRFPALGSSALKVFFLTLKDSNSLILYLDFFNFLDQGKILDIRGKRQFKPLVGPFASVNETNPNILLITEITSIAF